MSRFYVKITAISPVHLLQTVRQFCNPINSELRARNNLYFRALAPRIVFNRANWWDPEKDRFWSNRPAWRRWSRNERDAAHGDTRELNDAYRTAEWPLASLSSGAYARALVNMLARCKITRRDTHGARARRRDGIMRRDFRARHRFLRRRAHVGDRRPWGRVHTLVVRSSETFSRDSAS